MNKIKPILYIISGLPGSGKTVLSQMLVKYLGAVYLRIDTIEQGLRDLCSIKVGGEGYRLSYRIASDNLLLGISVVADSCNPIELTRKEWEQIAIEANANFTNIEIICSDKTEHRKRVENRNSTISKLILPTWKEVESREYHPWTSDRIVIDTASKKEEESFQDLISILNQKSIIS